jgi:molybdopterin-binding protein
MKKIYTLSIALVLSAFVFNNKAFATTYYSKSSGALNTLANWGVNPDGSGAAPPTGSFTDLVSHTFIITNRPTAFSHTVTWNLNSLKTVVVGDGISPVDMTISGGLAKIASTNVQVANTATLTLAKNSALPGSTFLTLDNNSTVKYNLASGTASVINANYGNLTIASTSTLTTDIIINGILTINNTITLDIKGHVLEIDGTIAPTTGELITDNTSVINIISPNLGNMGTLRMNGASPILNQLALGFIDPSGYVTLGNNLTLTGTGGYFLQQTGGIDLNGKTLTIDVTSDASFAVVSTDGVIRGNANSSLILNGTIGANSGSSDLFMDPIANTLKVLAVNSANPLNLGSALNITDSLSISGSTFKTVGFLTLKSTNALKGRVAEIKSGGSIIGDITVETFAKAGLTGWTNLGPSGVGGLTISSWDGQIPMSCAGCINDANSAGGYFVSVQGDPIGNGTYTELTGSTPLNPGTGYWIYLGNGQTTTTDMVWTVTGPIVTGAKGSGTGFISNPYPSPISLQRLQATNPGMGAADVFNPDNGTFTTFNGGIPSNGVIPMGQGFYITAGATINFLESHKVSYNTSANPLLKTTTPSSYIGSVFQLQVQGANGDLDNTYLRFHGNATPGFDIDLDGYKKFASPGYLGYPGPYSKYTTISTKVGTADYSINSLPYANTSNAVIPIMVKVSATGTYSIIPIDIANLPSGACVTLKDKLLNVTHDLRNGAYVCSINDTTSTARFELTICADVTAGISSLSVDQNTTLINQDINGAYVKTSFETNTKATISAYNVMGQRLMADKEIEGKDLTTYLDLGDVHGQVVIIRVTTAKTSTTKKIFIN